MDPEKPFRRMTLRQLLTHAEKCSRDLIEHLRATLLLQVSEFRDLSRPVRRRSHYPTMVAMQNALKKLLAAGTEAQTVAEHLHEATEEIRQHAKREAANRRR